MWPAPSNCTSQSFANFHILWQKFLLTITNFYFLLLKCDLLSQIARTKVFLAYTFQDKKFQRVKLVMKCFREQNGLTWHLDLETSNVHKKWGCFQINRSQLGLQELPSGPITELIVSIRRAPPTPPISFLEKYKHDQLRIYHE